MEFDQKAKTDKGKRRLTLVPTQIINDIAEVREYGINKYPGDVNNWKKVEIERYRDALFRHLLLYLNDPYGVDEESGIKHLSHIACNVAFLCELEKDKGNKKLGLKKLEPYAPNYIPEYDLPTPLSRKEIEKLASAIREKSDLGFSFENLRNMTLHYASKELEKEVDDEIRKNIEGSCE